MEGEAETETQEAPETTTTPEAAEPAAGAQPSSGQPPAAAAQDEFAGFDEATKKRVSEIVSKRVNAVNAKWKPYEEFGKAEDLRGRLTRAEQLENWAAQIRAQQAQAGQKLPGQAAKPETEHSEQDKVTRAYMEKLYPGLASWEAQQRQQAARLEQLDNFRWQQLTSGNKTALKEVALKAGYAEEHVDGLEQHVANSIRGNQQDYVRYMTTGDPAIVKKHFEAVDKWVKGMAPKPPMPTVPPVAKYAADKAKTQKLPPRMPATGVPAPTAGKRKMTNDERISAAFEALKTS